jgi:malonyl-CoA/methylmalonyl-CoA synthetase
LASWRVAADQLLYKFESGKLGAVVGEPHPDFGEAVTAVVVKQKGAALDEAAVVAHVKGQLANFKVPKRVVFVDDLPRNAMGKVQKNILRDQLKG